MRSFILCNVDEKFNESFYAEGTEFSCDLVIVCYFKKHKPTFEKYTKSDFDKYINASRHRLTIEYIESRMCSDCCAHRDKLHCTECVEKNAKMNDFNNSPKCETHTQIEINNV